MRRKLLLRKKIIIVIKLEKYCFVTEEHLKFWYIYKTQYDVKMNYVDQGVRQKETADRVEGWVTAPEEITMQRGDWWNMEEWDKKVEIMTMHCGAQFICELTRHK